MANPRSLLSLSIGFLCCYSAYALSISSTILVISNDATRAAQAAAGLRGYGIPYTAYVASSTTSSLPNLNSSSTRGNFGGILLTDDGILGTSQFDAIHSYQTSFNVRLVIWNASPSSDYGTKYAVADSGCCSGTTQQTVFFTNTTGFSTAGVRLKAEATTDSLWHEPATISNSSIAWEVAGFSIAGAFKKNTTAAVVNRIGGREQMVWFLPFELSWSQTSAYLQHACIHWMTRGLYLGFRRVLLSTQVDDVHLPTVIYDTKKIFRLRAEDLEAHKTWTADINARMNAGSDYFMELAHNGNGNIDNSSSTSPSACIQGPITYVTNPSNTDLEYIKPIGTGTDCWPSKPSTFVWNASCVAVDPLQRWFQASSANVNAFAHVSHTFTHESLNNATYADANREIAFNKAWLVVSGLAAAEKISTNSLVPPAITGLHNGDALQAWSDNGITAAVGDNTRPVLANQQNEFWPLITTVAGNGLDGMTVVPRWSTSIYYNCDSPSCIVTQYGDMYGSSTFDSILATEKNTNAANLFGLRHDPFMFHQANLRQVDVAKTSYVGGTSKQLSVMQVWTETVVGEIIRLTTWPIKTLTLDHLAANFLNRMRLDACSPQLTYNLSSNANATGRGTTIDSVTLSAASTVLQPACAGVRIPVTFPGPVKQVSSSSTTSTTTTEQVGSDPLTVWVTWMGVDVTFELQTGVSV